MNQRKALKPHEIRVIKIDRKAILELIWEILSEISYEKFRLPHNIYYSKKICIDWFFDEKQCEIILSAHSRAYEVNTEAVITCIKNLSLEAIDSLLLNPNGKEYYHTIHDTSFVTGHSTSIRMKEEGVKGNVLGMLFDNLGIRIRPLRKHEIRLIRLSQQAIHELLWEHFMKTGDEVMDIPEEEIDDIRTIYHMYIKGKLEELTLYVMNFNEASDKAFIENQAYCDQNIHFTTDSYSKKPINGRNYVSVMLSKS